jgi:holo-[acyl-carrier protein] synthase
MIANGVDLTEIAPFARMLERHGDRFLTRIYSPREQQLCAGRVPLLACLFAAKEGVAKALGVGLNYMAASGVDLRELEILAEQQYGQAQVCLYGSAQVRAAQLGLHSWSVCLAHSSNYALAQVLALRGPGYL